MNLSPVLRRSLMVLGSGLLLAACGGGAEEASSAPTLPSEEASTSKSPLDYDENLHCVIPWSSVTCQSGIQMYAWYDVNVGYFIPRDVCAKHGGPVVCPY
ncbi:hypothetical protein LZ198_40240 [Myxococcus sp. K15C18031901]|uniref:hypothetical protein n=1 Tax=Myxococcus dinghuensis TaxID=2906761 RepID=UPI0020A80F96|nr:hypothetical protein [Myxococcus dinghuensis]MCP3105116.1 hypothetical protein [Myxococcus dinghuensis]